MSKEKTEVQQEETQEEMAKRAKELRERRRAMIADIYKRLDVGRWF